MRALLFLLFWPALSFGADLVSVSLDRVVLPDLARVVFAEVAEENYILSSEAVKAVDTVSINIRGVEKSALLVAVSEVLTLHGLSVERRAGVVWIDKAKTVEEGETFYRPKFRSVSYLVDLLSPLFKQGSFTLQRGLPNPQQQQQHQQQGGMVQGQPPMLGGAPSVVDTGSSVYSMMDKNPDAFFFKGGVVELAKLRRLLTQIDVSTPELLVKAVVYEVSTGKADSSAFSLALSVLGGRLGVTLGKAGQGDYSAVLKTSTISAVIDSLASDSRFKVVSSPTLRVKSGSSARLTVGTETPVLGAVQLGEGGKALQSVEYRSSGVIFDLKPEIRGEVADLTISQQISNFIPTTNGVNSSPTLIKRELSTAVGVKDDEILVLGGLDEDKSTQESAGLSFLPKWLRSASDSGSRSEILLILQAQRL